MKKNIEEAILSYGDQIVHINNIVNQVRQTPDVYLGATGNSRYLTMCREIAQNSIDEIVKGVASSPIINIRMSEKDYFFEVEDNGRGIPHGKINIVYGVVHSSSNYEKKEGIYPSGKNGCGGSVTNMLSHKFTVDSYVLGKGIHVEFIEGVMWDKGEVKIPAKESVGKQGSRVSFIPNQQFTGPLTVTCSDVYNLIYFITHIQ
jgi:DNA gyrase/topoisomerase IV subunit B